VKEIIARQRSRKEATQFTMFLASGQPLFVRLVRATSRFHPGSGRIEEKVVSTRILLLAMITPVLVHSVLFTPARAQDARVKFTRDFAPTEGWVKPVEAPLRQEVCLNGLWQFQPVRVPAGFARDRGVAPELTKPDAAGWERVPIKIPSPWNVNTWGAGRDTGEGSSHPYWPSSVYYPSYPPLWDGVEMGWLARTFRVPESWGERRIILHFEAVAGHAQVFVNGRIAGEHFDRFLPFELDITELVRRGADNELSVGVRAMRLFDRKSPTYKFMRAPYPPGSTTDQLIGIWQDVFLLGLPAVRAVEPFVKPSVDRDTLEVEVTVRNDSGRDQTVDVAATVQPWVNLAGATVLAAPEPRWRLGPSVMSLAPEQVRLKAGETRTISLSAQVAGRLRLWSPESPSLYALLLTVDGDGRRLDRCCTRFGWRQLRIAGPDLLLNGTKIQMFGDLLHPFGPFINSRRYVWAWYRMIKDMHGNAVRPHAQPHPRIYLDLADEMGLLVLDETAMFGSSLQLDFDSPSAWSRYAQHFDDLVLRDRNHPSVFGWSFGNELFATFLYDPAITSTQADLWYGRLGELGKRSRRLDPTRDWVSCDGDEDLRGALPVWSKHFGHGLAPEAALAAAPGKPLMVGESGGSYYARASQLAEFNGARAFASYTGRNEALAIDVYDNIAKRARPSLTFFSAAETAWFGLEHLPFGYRDFTRLPGKDDGVWFKPFEEGKPGMQPERIPPYVCTLNPGFDSALPFYKPLPMFLAQQAAQAPGGPQPCAWDHRPSFSNPVPAAAPASAVGYAAFAGARDGDLARRLVAVGLAINQVGQATPPRLLVVDAETLDEPGLATAQEFLRTNEASGGATLVMVRKSGRVSPAVQRLLPAALSISSRRATALIKSNEHSWTAGLGPADLDFSEDATSPEILKCGLDGPLLASGRVLLAASNTDWSLFNGAPESAKCAAVLLDEQLQKPAGAALLEITRGKGSLILSSLDVVPSSKANTAFWRRLFSRAGVAINAPTLVWLVPAGIDNQPGATWQYVLARPSGNWRETGFDDSTWRTGKGGFGSPSIPNAKTHTLWETSEIWLRATFQSSQPEASGLKLQVYHDEDVEVFVNGVLALRRAGHVTEYEQFDLPPEAAAAIKPGRNVLAVHCLQTAGAQFVDVGLGRAAGSPSDQKPHDLLLDGPPENKPAPQR
jgi:beta-galactosidase